MNPIIKMPFISSLLTLMQKAVPQNNKYPDTENPYNGKPYKKFEVLEPDKKSQPLYYGPYNIPGITVEASNLNKKYRFPYGGINVISKSINGGLDHKQKVVLNPFEGHENNNLPTKNKLLRKGGIINKLQFGNKLPTAPEGVTKYDTLKRRFNTAWGVAKQQYGGPVERADNTRVVLGKPLQINNKIPYGAGKGPAADSPMRLFNDPYIGIGMMAMAPIASRGFSSTKPASVNKFSTYIKGLPKSMSTSNKVAIGAGTVGGITLGYDDNHNQYVREGLRKIGIEFPLGLNPKGDSIYNDRHIFDNLLKYMLKHK